MFHLPRVPNLMSIQSDSANAALPLATQPNGASIDRSTNRILFPQLGSSEETPSVHSSVCDAAISTSADGSEELNGQADDSQNSITNSRPRRGTRRSSGGIGGRPCASPPLQDGKQPVTIAVRFLNNPNGTPLTTITEQQSFATLKSQASAAYGVRHITPLCADPLPNTIKCNSEPARRAGRRACYSVDELTLQQLRRSNDPGLDYEAGSEALEAVPCCNHAQPLTPLYPPLERVATPPGAPRWPGDLPTGYFVGRRRLSDSVRGLFRIPSRTSSVPQQGSQGPVSARRHLFRRASDVALAAGRAYWRPPNAQSGHGNFAMHPFLDVPLHSPPLAIERARSGTAESTLPLQQCPAALQAPAAGPGNDSARNGDISNELNSRTSSFPTLTAQRISTEPLVERTNARSSHSSSISSTDSNCRRSRRPSVSAPTKASLPVRTSAPGPPPGSIQYMSSAALDALLPIAAAEGIVRRREIALDNVDPLHMFDGSAEEYFNREGGTTAPRSTCPHLQDAASGTSALGAEGRDELRQPMKCWMCRMCERLHGTKDWILQSGLRQPMRVITKCSFRPESSDEEESTMGLEGDQRDQHTR